DLTPRVPAARAALPARAGRLRYARAGRPARAVGRRPAARAVRAPARSHHLRQPRRGAPRAVALHVAIVHLAADLGGDRLGDHLRGGGLEVQLAARAVALQAVRDVVVLLEMVAQREEQE